MESITNWKSLRRQNPEDGQLTLEDLQSMVGNEAEQFSNRVLRFASSLRGTRQYWMQQRTRLISMVDTLGMPTIFFTHSAADLHWPDLHRLSETQNSTQNSDLIENPALADWLFYYRFQKFIDVFYRQMLGAVDFWYRFEWQHRGSPHVHGIAWLRDAPNVEKTLLDGDASQRRQLIQFIHSVVCTYNPALQPDGTDLETAPQASIKQKLLINSIGERDFSAQETCHLLLQLPMFKASRDFVVLTLDGSRLLQNVRDGQISTAPSILDHYINRPTTAYFEDMTLLIFARSYIMPKELSAEPTFRRKQIIVITRPYCSPDPNGPSYEQYCKQKLMLHVKFRQLSDLLMGNNTYIESYQQFLSLSDVPSSLEEEIRSLQPEQSSEDDPDQVSVISNSLIPLIITILIFAALVLFHIIMVAYTLFEV